MKLKFNSSLEYQNHAIQSVVDLFDGLLTKSETFWFRNYENIFQTNDYGIANQIVPLKIFKNNLNKIQTRNYLLNTNLEDEKQKVFDIEMETGTGKTYVYLKTIFELNKKYNFKKFVIVVPSIAIKEGVLKTLEITREHFLQQYRNIEYNYFNYDSNKLTKIKNFSYNKDIQIMIINIQSFDKDKNIFNLPRESLFGQKPIELIQKTNPIIIIDEPQSTANTEKSKEAIDNLNPNFILRYSATFPKRNDEHLVYKLDAVDAYKKGLVKKIEVCGCEIQNDYSNFARVISTNPKDLSATLEFINYEGKKTKKKIKLNQDLYDLSKRNDHRGFLVNEINFNDHTVEFANGKIASPNYESNPNIDLEIKKTQIDETIKFHLDKQLVLKKHNIKVLSLFFIDEVSNYRKYDENKIQFNGIYADYFEKSFIKIAKNPKYESLFVNKNIDKLSKKIHNGYFSIDKYKHFSNSKTGDSKSDIDTYSLIMKDKEKLLSFDEELCFIFSHSALKEGWDNPNVFQVCTLNTSNSYIKKRQQIGRGLRLPVNQDGERQYDIKNNKLTIIANESYEQFAEQLQQELIEDGLNQQLINKSSFVNNSDEYCLISEQRSNEIFYFLVQQKYLSKDGKPTPSLLNNFHNLSLQEINLTTNELLFIKSIFKQNNTYINIENAKKKVLNKVNEAVYLSEEFKQLWQNISQKTIYKIKFDTEKFLSLCNQKIDENLLIQNKIILVNTCGDINLKRNGIVEKEKPQTTNVKEINDCNPNLNIYDIVNEIVNTHELTKKTIINLILNPKLKDYWQTNSYLVKSILNKVIKEAKNELICNGIEYVPIESYYQQQIIEDSLEEIYLNNKNYIDIHTIENGIEKYACNYLVFDSNIEKDFANDSFKNKFISKFIKLPKKFKIDTPLGTYNPDWALLNENGLSLIAETKGSLETLQLREIEKNKIMCGFKHFNSLNKNVNFYQTDNLNNLLVNILTKNKKIN